MMRAVILTKSGPVLQKVPIPKLESSDEVLVHIEAAGKKSFFLLFFPSPDENTPQNLSPWILSTEQTRLLDHQSKGGGVGGVFFPPYFSFAEIGMWIFFSSLQRSCADSAANANAT